MLLKTALVILVCLACSTAFVSENVIFQKLSDITTTRSRWLVAFTIEMSPYEDLLNKLSLIINNTLENSARIIIWHGNADRYKQILATNALFRNELSNLANKHLNLRNRLNEIKSLHNANWRGKRSLIPIVGKALSYLFGTLTSDDISSIVNNVKSLARNQKNIAHVLSESLSIVGVSQKRILENRKTINKVISSLFDLRTESRNISRELQDLHRYVVIYAEMDRMMGEARELVLIAENYMQHIELQLNMLSLGHLSPSLISPKDLRELLTEIETKLPRVMSLPANPRKDLWLLYSTLTCTTVLHNDSIVVVLNIPLLDYERQFELYKVHNLDIPLLNHTDIVDYKFMAKYQLESRYLAINKRRTQYALLSEMEAKNCLANNLYCHIKSPVYAVMSSKMCVIKLVLNIEPEIKKYCRKIVDSNIVLPKAEYLSDGHWLISTKTPLQFSIECDKNDKDLNHIKTTLIVKPPVATIKLPMSCSGYSGHITLPPYYNKESKYNISDSMVEFVKSYKVVSRKFWQPFQLALAKFPTIKIPKKLEQFKEKPLDKLIGELSEIHSNLEPMNITFSIWHYIGFALFISIILLIIICCCKTRLRVLAKIIKSKLATKSGKNKLRRLADDPGEVTNSIEMVPLVQTTSAERSTLDRETATEVVMPSAPKIFNVNQLYPKFEDASKL